MLAHRPAHLEDAIAGIDILLASAPPTVTSIILKHCPFASPPQLLSPAFVRKCILREHDAVAAACAKQPRFAPALLDYCLSVRPFCNPLLDPPVPDYACMS